jgi:hypothetical protein
MQQVKITVSVSDGFFQRYSDEARREGVKVEDLVQQTANVLLKEMEDEENDLVVSMS